jgi:hypothetical protein
MTQQYVTDQGTLIIPGSYADYKVQTDNSGLSTSGVLVLVGEADAGPDFSLEDDLEANSFGPDQVPEVLAKYRSGALVDAFRAAASPANDPGITGSPSRIVLVKTNVSTKARLPILRWDGGTYGFLADRSYGRLGNLLSAAITAKTAESLPTTGSFTWIPPVGTVAYDCRVNGGAAVGGTLAAASSPAATQAALNALAGVLASGGADRLAHPATGTLAVSVVSGNSIQVTASAALGATPTIGDTLVIPLGSIIAGASNVNVGGYVVTGGTANTILATKLSDAAKTGAVIGTITAPAAVVATAVSGTPANDVKVFQPVTITLEAGNPIDGIGKTLAISQLTAGTDLLERSCYLLGTINRVADQGASSWVSRTADPKLLTAVAEHQAQLVVSRAADNVSITLSAGGEIALRLGYLGTTASLVISDSVLTTTVTGGTGVNLSLSLKEYPTLQDLADFINKKTGYTCSVGSGILGALPPSALDDVTTTCATTFGGAAARLKVDAYKFSKAIVEQGGVVQLEDAAGTVIAAPAGIPAPIDNYLDGGAKGGSTSAQVLAAVDALEKVRCNFVIPLFSRDATADIIDALTESSSTYVLDSIHAAVRSHTLKMSTLKRRKNRQAFLSKKGTFQSDKETAANIATFRACMTFQDVKALAGDGTIKQFQPWMGAVLAAAMQAAGFYRPIVNKGINCSGALQAAKDFDDRNDTNLEDALLAGLLPIKRSDQGGYVWVSDQTTYGKDSNFVFNSIQATYCADLIAMTTAQRMERAFVGQSVADVSAPLALSFLESVLSDFLRLKLTAASDDAPKGYKNVRIQIKGPAMVVSLEVKLAGALYFIPISFLVSQVQQTAAT